MDLVTRSQWGARPPRSTTSLSKPQGLAVHWNGPPMGLTTHGKCPGAVKSIQRFHMDTRKWADVAYNFLICPHGVIFEGRGWGRRSAANGTNVGNSWGHAAMVMVGERESVPSAVYAALGRLNAEHRRRYGRSQLRPHSSFKSTVCPGPVLTDWVRQNPNPAAPTTYKPASEEDIVASINDLKKALRDERAAGAEAAARATLSFVDHRTEQSIQTLVRRAAVLSGTSADADRLAERVAARVGPQVSASELAAELLKQLSED